MKVMYSNYLEESFKPHLFIEFFFGHDKMFLSEHMQRKELYPLLLEEYGVFPDCRQMAEDLTYKVKELTLWEMSIPVKFDKEWIETIILKATKKVGEASYEPSESTWDEKSDRFRSVTILLNINNIGKNDFYPLLMHELTHIYQDYNLRKNGSSLEIKLRSLGVNKNPTIYTETYEELKRRISWLLYHFNDFERSSYISQIEGYLDNTQKVFSDIKEVLDYLKTTTPYQNYVTMFRWTNEFLSVDEGLTQSKILSYVGEFSNLQFLSYKKFRQWLKEKMIRYQNKFNTVLPKLAYRHLNMVEYINPPTVNFLIK